MTRGPFRGARRGSVATVGACLAVGLWLPFGLFGTRAKQATEDGAERYEAGDYDGARASFERALRDYPDAPEPAYDRAATLYKGEAFEDAEKAFDTVAQSAQGGGLSDLEESARFAQGNALFRQGKYRDAIAAYDQALALKPGDTDAKENRALAEEMLEQPPQQREQQPQQPQQRQPQPEGDQTPGPYPGPPLSGGESQPDEQQPESSPSQQPGGGTESTTESTGQQPDDSGQGGGQAEESQGADSPSGPLIDQRIPTPPPSANYRPMPEDQADMLLRGERSNERMGRAGRLSESGDPFSDAMEEMERQFLGDFGTRRPQRRPSRPPW